MITFLNLSALFFSSLCIPFSFCIPAVGSFRYTFGWIVFVFIFVRGSFSSAFGL